MNSLTRTVFSIVAGGLILSGSMVFSEEPLTDLVPYRHWSLPTTLEWRVQAEPFPHYRAYHPNGGQPVFKGYLFSTEETAPGVRGYAGPITLLVFANPDFTLRGCAVIKHTETPSIAGGIERKSWLKQFRGLGPEDAFEVGKTIDAVSGATYSSKAVARTLQRSLTKLRTVSTP